MALLDYIKRYTAGRNGTPTVVGIRHQIGLSGETHWIDDVVKWLDKRIKSGDKVMLEIPEYPLGDLFNSNVFSRVRSYMTQLCDHLHEKGCEIVPGEDRERFGTNDEQYHKKHVRDDDFFIPRMRTVRPRFFLVGYAHLDYLREKMPEFEYVNLVDEKKDNKRCSWLNVDLDKKF